MNWGGKKSNEVNLEKANALAKLFNSLFNKVLIRLLIVHSEKASVGSEWNGIAWKKYD